MHYTSDWFSARIPSWKKHLSGFIGVTGTKALELGTYEGRSAVWLCQNVLSDRGCSLTCIDRFDGAPYRNFLSNIVEADVYGKIHIIRGDAHVKLSQLTEMFDIIYIDADHVAASVLHDAVVCFHKLKPAGVMIFDDYEWIHPNGLTPPKPAIDAFLDIFKDKIEVLEIGWQVIVRKRMTQ